MSPRARRVIYLTHPEVKIDPVIAVTDWRLSGKGKARVAALAGRLRGLQGALVVSSQERKALETAAPLAAAAGCEVTVRPGLHENDRSATGFLPGAEFETAADAFFANPETSVRGWERAADAQARILAELRTVMAQHVDRDLIVAGHGAVGTLLYCHLAGLTIDRKWDQPGCGHWFGIDAETGRPLAHWAPMESLTAM